MPSDAGHRITIPMRTAAPRSPSNVDLSTPAHRRTLARRDCRIKLVFHNGVRAAVSAPPPGLEKRAESGENKHPKDGLPADVFCDESLFSSLLEPIAKLSFPSLL